ncbi:hypothetical protein [Ferrimonas sp. YFM]|uniref:hypothetical protein n=1 Tax=Ferrimonas sp. YFM TaxID=3028878 RepID=UPI002574566A|nr:hypothetical protein [Ferrimonas sp. YFM]BDY04840.1 DUF481 domain-containing protein [Ferrimonas sp. YFM]
MRYLPLLLLLTPSVFARPFDSGFSLRVGGFWADVDSSFGARTVIGDNPIRIDFESDLALDESKFSPFVELTYRFDEKNMLSLNYLTLHRNAQSRSLTKSFEFDWEGNSYQVEAGANLRSELDVDIYQLVYGRTLILGDNYALLSTLGVHIMDVHAVLSGDLTLVGEGGNEMEVTERAIGDITAPLPDIGLIFGWQPAENWLISFHTQYLKVSLDDVDGRLLDWRLQAAWYLLPNLALGLAWQNYELDVEEKRRFSDIDVQFNYEGPSLMLHYEF